MKKIAVIVLASFLLYWVGKSPFTNRFSNPTPKTVMAEATFVNIIRDLELFNSWLLTSYDPKETIDKLRHQNHEKILALYKVDPNAFKESIKYYLEDNVERALAVYDKVYIALEALSTQ